VNVVYCEQDKLFGVKSVFRWLRCIFSFKRTWKIYHIHAIGSQIMNTLSLTIAFSITFLVLTYNVNGMFLYNKFASNLEIPYFSSFWPRKYMTFVPFRIPSYNVVIVSYASLLDYLSFNLIAWHILFCKKNKITKIIKYNAWSPSPPFFKVLRVIHLKKKVRKNKNVKPFI
jgi:hypothetical protein